MVATGEYMFSLTAETPLSLEGEVPPSGGGEGEGINLVTVPNCYTTEPRRND